jgi:hypothetical protein
VTWRDGVGPVTRRARHIVDDSDGLFVGGIGFEDDGAVRVEELVGDVGQDGGATGGDAAFGDENEEAGEELVDVNGGVELGELGEKVGGEVFRVVLRGLSRGGDQRGVAETEVGASIQNSKTATATVGGEMAAAWMIGRAGFSGCEGHFLFLSLEREGHTLRRDKKST